MRHVRLLEAAVQEAIEAAVRYEAARSGLGSQFDTAVSAALDLSRQAFSHSFPLQAALANVASSGS